MRPTIRAMYPNLKNTDISGVLAQHWKTASEESKRPHLDRELQEREKYHEDMAKWKEEVLNTSDGNRDETGESLDDADYGLDFFNSLWADGNRSISITFYLFLYFP